TIAILDSASASRRSYSPEITALGSASSIGLVLGMAMVFLVSWRDDRFNSTAEISEKFGNVIVGQVPDIELNRSTDSPLLLAVDDRRDMYAEAYRNLRSALFFMPGLGERPKILLVTSALPNEGKSTVTANLARILALSGANVLLVDADLRRGRLHELLGLRCEPGFADLLEAPEHLASVIQKDGLPNLSFIPRGKNLANPGDLFLSPKVNTLFTLLREEFDYVLIDTSPVFAVDDAPTLAPKVDGTLF